eukprot:scaffold227766_cov20-Tisochrysis_lutea.AAC.5
MQKLEHRRRHSFWDWWYLRVGPACFAFPTECHPFAHMVPEDKVRGRTIFEPLCANMRLPWNKGTA